MTSLEHEANVIVARWRDEERAAHDRFLKLQSDVGSLVVEFIEAAQSRWSPRAVYGLSQNCWLVATGGASPSHIAVFEDGTWVWADGTPHNHGRVWKVHDPTYGGRLATARLVSQFPGCKLKVAFAQALARLKYG
jgi:hypothetical protein